MSWENTTTQTFSMKISIKNEDRNKWDVSFQNIILVYYTQLICLGELHNRSSNSSIVEGSFSSIIESDFTFSGTISVYLQLLQ